MIDKLIAFQLGTRRRYPVEFCLLRRAQVAKRMGLLKLKEWYEKMLEVAKSRGIVVDYQDMQEEYKDIESIEDIPIFSGDHWAASIVKKVQEQRNKEDASQHKKRTISAVDNGAAPTDGDFAGGGSACIAGSCASTGGICSGVAGSGGASSCSGKAIAETKDEQLLSQITEEMRSMRNHFIVVTLVELKKGQCRAIIRDPVPLISNEFVDTRSAFLEKCQMYHWQFDELRNAQHSTLMLLYHLHGMHKVAKAKLHALNASQTESNQSALNASVAARHPLQVGTSRSSKIETAMHDWSTLLAHANKAATLQSWTLPPDDLFQRILAQINRSKRDILQEKYNACLSPSCSAQTRSVFIRVLKRIAESFMTCLLQMQMQGGAAEQRLNPTRVPV